MRNMLNEGPQLNHLLEECPHTNMWNSVQLLATFQHSQVRRGLLCSKWHLLNSSCEKAAAGGSQVLNGARPFPTNLHLHKCIPRKSCKAMLGSRLRATVAVAKMSILTAVMQ